jgi:hypothetical protein
VFDYPTYTLQNLNLNTIQILESINIFNEYSQLYQYLKIRSIQITLTAVTKNGSNPPAGYMAFIGNESTSPDYSKLPTYQGSIKIKPLGTTTARFTRTGRNDDFNKWYNTQSNLELERMDASIYFRFDAPFENDKGYYQVRISYNIVYQSPFLGVTTKNTADPKENQFEEVKVGSVISKFDDLNINSP